MAADGYTTRETKCLGGQHPNSAVYQMARGTRVRTVGHRSVFWTSSTIEPIDARIFEKASETANSGAVKHYLKTASLCRNSLLRRQNQDST